MEMWLKGSILVLLTGLGVSGQVYVDLDDRQKTVEVPHGSTVTFHCRLSPPTYDRLRVFWYFNPSSFNDSEETLDDKIVNKSAKTSDEASNETEGDAGHEERETDATWRMHTLINVTERDSGWYFCKVTVEIPLLNRINSSGTEVVITKSKEHTPHPSLPIVTATASPADNFSAIEWWMWIVLGVSTAVLMVLLVLLVVCVLLRRRSRRRRSREEDPVYTNTRPVANRQPSPRPVPDHLKAGSSSQNLQSTSPGGKRVEGNRRYK